MNREAELQRIAAAFEVAKLFPHQPGDKVTWSGKNRGGLVFTCWLDLNDVFTLFDLSQETGPKAARQLAHVYQLDSGTWRGEFRESGRLPMARGLYRFGFDGADVWEQLRGVLSLDDCFELRATLPLQFHPSRFPVLSQ